MIHDRGATEGDLAPATESAWRMTLSPPPPPSGPKRCARVETVTGDLLDDAAPEQIISACVDALGGIDILVNNAGIGYLFGPLVDLQHSHLDAVLGVNLRAPCS